MAASATFALKAGVWFRRGRLLMVSPDSRGTACPPSGRNSTYRPVQISGTSSVHGPVNHVHDVGVWHLLPLRLARWPCCSGQAHRATSQESHDAASPYRSDPFLPAGVRVILPHWWHG